MSQTPGNEELTPNEKISALRHARGDEEIGRAAQSPEWMHRKYNFGPLHFPGYATPPVQLVIVAFVCFMCPGMFNAINGLGGAGQLATNVSDNSNVAVYSTFSVVGFFAGSFANRLGLRLTLSFGGLGYFIYVSSYLSYNRNANAGFVYFAGAFLGVCAGLLWTAQGAIMLSYPDEASKGRYISWFWGIFNMGAVIGSLYVFCLSELNAILTWDRIPLGENLHSTAGRVSDGTYIGFMALTLTGAVLAWCLVDARHVRRADGSHVVLMKHPTWKSEFLGLWQVLRSDPYIMLLFPMFLASNWFYTYQPNVVNLPRFNIRTRSLNSTLYWSSQIVAALLFGYVLDLKSFRRTTKAKAALAVLFVLTMTIWGGGYAWQKQYTRADTDDEAVKAGYVKLDWTSSGYVGPMFLYIFYGFFDGEALYTEAETIYIGADAFFSSDMAGHRLLV